MKRPLRESRGCIFMLYVAALPVYLLRFVFLAVRLLRLRRISTLGYVTCPHCRAENAIDVLTTCPRCKTIEYGNRLRCTGCGVRSTAFLCDTCGVTIHCF